MPEEAGQRRRPDFLIAARDASYLRLAAATLSRAGYDVRTTADRLGRVERLMRLHAPDVLVLEADHDRVVQIRARVPASRRAIAILLVVDDPTRTCHDGADAVVAKWAPATELLDAVQRARAEAAGPHGGGGFPPRLRLVKP